MKYVGENSIVPVRLSLIILIAALALAFGFNYGTIRAHCADTGLHHTLGELDQRYVPREAVEAKLEHIHNELRLLEQELKRGG